MSFAPAARLRLAAHEIRTQRLGPLGLPIGGWRFSRRRRIRVVAHDPETLHRFMRFAEIPDYRPVVMTIRKRAAPLIILS